jgi:hypothetical protein
MNSVSNVGDVGELAQLVPFSEVAKSLPPSRAGRPVHVSTISRWRCPGVRGRDGERITLRCLRLPSGWVTTGQWIQEFLDAVTAARSGGPAPPPVPLRTSARRQQEINRAKRELAAAGY